MRILVTGSGGFIGQHLVGALTASGAEVIEGRAAGLDLRDGASIRQGLENTRPEVIINLAGQADPRAEARLEMVDLNVMGVLRLLDAAEACGVRRFVQASTGYVYGQHTPEPVKEDDRLFPLGDYAISKHSAELHCLERTGTLEIAIGRIFNGIGVGQKPQYLLPKIVKHYAEMAPVLELGRTDVVRDFLDVRDVARGFCALATKPLPHAVYNIGSGVGHSITQILSMLEALSRHSPELRHNPAFVRAKDNTFLVANTERLNALGVAMQHQLVDTLHGMWDEQRQLGA